MDSSCSSLLLLCGLTSRQESTASLHSIYAFKELVLRQSCSWQILRAGGRQEGMRPPSVAQTVGLLVWVTQSVSCTHKWHTGYCLLSEMLSSAYNKSPNSPWPRSKDKAHLKEAPCFQRSLKVNDLSVLNRMMVLRGKNELM